MEKTLSRLAFEGLDAGEESYISDLDGSGSEEGEEERETRLLVALQSRKGKRSGGFQSMGKPLNSLQILIPHGATHNLEGLYSSLQLVSNILPNSKFLHRCCVSLGASPSNFPQHVSTHLTARGKGGSRNFGPLCLGSTRNRVELIRLRGDLSNRLVQALRTV